MDQIVRERGFDLDELARNLWMTNEDLRKLVKKGHRLGLHSFDHPYEMACLTIKEQQAQYKYHDAQSAGSNQRSYYYEYINHMECHPKLR